MKTKTAAIALALSAMGFALAASAQDDDAERTTHVTTSPMVEFADSGRIPGPHDASTLVRKTNWVDVGLHTSGLDPATAYTVWAVVFNRPQYCATTPCGMGDLPVAPGHDPRVQASVAYVTGGFSGNDGRLRQRGRLHRVHAGIKPTQTLFGPGLLDAAHAEVHFVLRGHGPASGDPLLAIGSYGAGCSDSNPCTDQQASIHLVP